MRYSLALILPVALQYCRRRDPVSAHSCCSLLRSTKGVECPGLGKGSVVWIDSAAARNLEPGMPRDAFQSSCAGRAEVDRARRRSEAYSLDMYGARRDLRVAQTTLQQAELRLFIRHNKRSV